MNRVYSFLFSGTFMGVLLIVFAFSIGGATFIENDFGTEAAKVLVYNALWFEGLLFLMVVNFVGMIFTNKLYRKNKLMVLVIHLSFIVIIIGAAITRYFGFEGQMHIRNGQTSNQFISSNTYVSGEIIAGDERVTFKDEVLFAPVRNNKYDSHKRINGKEVKLELLRFMPSAMEVVKSDDGGEAVISLVIADRSGRKNIFLKKNESKSIGGITFVFGDTSDMQAVQFMLLDQQLFFRAPIQIDIIKMSSGDVTSLSPLEFHQAEMMKLYRINNLNFVLKAFTQKGVIAFESGSAGAGAGSVQALEIKASVDDQDKVFYLKGGRGYVGEVNAFDLAGVQFNVSYGSQIMSLPFALKLKEFQLERYPGSESPSSYASEVTLIDEKEDLKMPYRIYMNHILDYKGYRFFQSSFDQDEKGTILSVNHDFLGTLITYIGYFLLFASLIASIFLKQSRFVKLSHQLKDIHKRRKKLAMTLILLLTVMINSDGYAQETGKPKPVAIDHADLFGKLLVQKRDGRVIPINTIANEVIVKVYKKNHFGEFNANQVLLGMLSNPFEWQKVEIIKVGNPELQSILKLKGKYAAFEDFFDHSGKYLLKGLVDEAFRKSPGKRNKLDKELIAVDERVNVCYMTYYGSLLNIYPLPEDTGKKWVTPFDTFQNIDKSDSLFIRTSLKTYVEAIARAENGGSYNEADKALRKIKDFQYKYGRETIPSDTRLNMEIIYNRISIFKRLFPVYMTLGLVLLVFFLIELFRPKSEFRKSSLVVSVILFIGFLAHTIGLALRWYISGHAPWSNGYESMIYIAWAGMLAGFLFKKQSSIALSVTALLSGIALLVAHMSWMNPEITNLVPVLKSYWLTIHVATITASYGFLALGSLMAFLNLGIMIFRTKKNLERIDLTILELSNTIEMALLIGLVLLTIGNFLGGIWANESWGRYWGWDPKETWSLVTIILYAFVLHLRQIPSLKSIYTFNFMAMISFASVIMTYFGVNYYLSGLHSYAKGDPVPIPDFVYYVVFVIGLVSILAAHNEMKLKGEEESRQSAVGSSQ